MGLIPPAETLLRPHWPRPESTTSCPPTTSITDSPDHLPREDAAAVSTFQTPQYTIVELLQKARSGELQLPDFQRPYRWDDERIRSLLVTILRGHPMGVIMTLRTGGQNVRFKPRPITGVPAEGLKDPELLLLDGQQRTTSMVQALTGDGIVDTEDVRHHKLRRRYFVDVVKALGDVREQEDAVVSLPDTGIVTENIGRDVVLDVTTEEKQWELGLMPVTVLFDSADCFAWMMKYQQALPERMEITQRFLSSVAQAVQTYKIPAIELDKDISKDAVATVFEKVNTGGLRLDVFELLTATFAGDRAYYEETGEDFRLAEDWALTEEVLRTYPVLTDMKSTDFLMAVSVLATLAKRREALAAGKTGQQVPQTSARREDILGMSLEDYRVWAPRLRKALPTVARHLRDLHIHDSRGAPYSSQVVSLLIITTLLGDRAEEHAVRARLNQWFWCGVLGELYGSTITTQLAKDAEQIPEWSLGKSAETPEAIIRASFSESRLGSLRTRLSAAYKGVYALIMAQQPPAKDWMLDQTLDFQSYDDLQVDIHHVFPRKWCDENGIEPWRRESIINKTPLAKKTNIRLRGDSPAVYTERLDDKGLTPQQVDAQISTHAIDPALLRAGDFDAFFNDRRRRLVSMIENAMCKPVVRDWEVDSESTDAPENFNDPAEMEADEPAGDEEAANVAD
ncbi:DUF262 domain-containing protein [Micrococcus sp. KBS0714]|nr:DUF262 domain-containing protein [Micrococcus sp. KBS0714]